MNKPGVNILELLISLYADQENVTIKYELEEKKECVANVA